MSCATLAPLHVRHRMKALWRLRISFGSLSSISFVQESICSMTRTPIHSRCKTCAYGSVHAKSTRSRHHSICYAKPHSSRWNSPLKKMQSAEKLSATAEPHMPGHVQQKPCYADFSISVPTTHHRRPHFAQLVPNFGYCRHARSRPFCAKAALSTQPLQIQLSRQSISKLFAPREPQHSSVATLTAEKYSY
jgi:hypothetical protein